MKLLFFFYRSFARRLRRNSSALIKSSSSCPIHVRWARSRRMQTHCPLLAWQCDQCGEPCGCEPMIRLYNFPIRLWPETVRFLTLIALTCQHWITSLSSSRMSSTDMDRTRTGAPLLNYASVSSQLSYERGINETIIIS